MYECDVDIIPPRVRPQLSAATSYFLIWSRSGLHQWWLVRDLRDVRRGRPVGGQFGGARLAFRSEACRARMPPVWSALSRLFLRLRLDVPGSAGGRPSRAFTVWANAAQAPTRWCPSSKPGRQWADRRRRSWTAREEPGAADAWGGTGSGRSRTPTPRSGK